MIRLYCEGFKGQQGEQIILDGVDHHYMVNVMRHKVGDALRVFNPSAGEWDSRVVAISRRDVVFETVCQVRAPLQPGRSIHLAAARLKPDAWGWMLEKATELGVTHIHPLITERVQFGKSWQADKWYSLIKGAAQQCERLDIPTLCEPQIFVDFVHNIPNNIAWYAALERSSAPSLKLTFGDVGLIIGPEGGFTKHEVDALTLCSHIQTITLGNNILRAETAAVSGLTLLVLAAS